MVPPKLHPRQKILKEASKDVWSGNGIIWQIGEKSLAKVVKITIRRPLSRGRTVMISLFKHPADRDNPRQRI